MSRYSKNASNWKPDWQFDPSRSNVALPKKLRCNVCSKVKTQEHFSNRTLGKVATMMKENRKINFEHTAKVPCDFCNVGNRTELECSECDKSKGLDKFSNGQRKQKENARCRDCVMEQHNSKPLGQEDFEDDDYEQDPEDDDDEAQQSGGVDLHQGIANIGLNGASSTSDGWLQQQPRGFLANTTSNRTTTVADSSARSSAGSSSAASNAVAPTRTVAIEQSSACTASDSATNTVKPGTKSAKADNQNSHPKLDMASDSGSDNDSVPGSDVSSVGDF